MSVWTRLGQRAQAVHGIVVHLSHGAGRRPVGVDRQLHAVLRQTRRRRRRIRPRRHADAAETQGSGPGITLIDANKTTQRAQRSTAPGLFFSTDENRKGRLHFERRINQAYYNTVD